jgi:CHAT domain-containing protein
MPGLAIIEYYVLPAKAVAFVIRPDRDEPIVERLDLDRAALRAAAFRLVDELSPENINPVHPEWSSTLDFLEPLGGALLDRVWPHLEDIETVCIVPHGYLFYIPFHALRLASGRYVIEDRAVVYAPSAALMAHARLHRRSTKPSRFVGVGTGKVDDPLARQKGFEEEARSLAALPVWQQSRAFTGVEASALAFLSGAGESDVVHCACHGYFDSADPFGSGLLLSDGDRLPALPAQGEWSDRCSLSARTIATSTIKADLVYLSACVSGRHDIRPGDELLGLVRALIRAGAASIVASLWPIAAWTSTRELMESFYTGWLVDGLSKARAMQVAQLKTMTRYPHPYHWAPFSLVGDWH